jgi:predicted site-specific integrase-resolvase
MNLINVFGWFNKCEKENREIVKLRQTITDQRELLHDYAGQLFDMHVKLRNMKFAAKKVISLRHTTEWYEIDAAISYLDSITK